MGHEPGFTGLILALAGAFLAALGRIGPESAKTGRIVHDPRAEETPKSPPTGFGGGGFRAARPRMRAARSGLPTRGQAGSRPDSL